MLETQRRSGFTIFTLIVTTVITYKAKKEKPFDLAVVVACRCRARINRGVESPLRDRMGNIASRVQISLAKSRMTSREIMKSMVNYDQRGRGRKGGGGE